MYDLIDRTTHPRGTTAGLLSAASSSPDADAVGPLAPALCTSDRCWNCNINGLSHQTDSFGAINLLGPRAPGSSNFWHADATVTQFKFEYVDGGSGQPIVLPTTYLMFFDFDKTCAAPTRRPAPHNIPALWI